MIPLLEEHLGFCDRPHHRLVEIGQVGYLVGDRPAWSRGRNLPITGCEMLEHAMKGRRLSPDVGAQGAHLDGHRRSIFPATGVRSSDP